MRNIFVSGNHFFFRRGPFNLILWDIHAHSNHNYFQGSKVYFNYFQKASTSFDHHDLFPGKLIFTTNFSGAGQSFIDFKI